MYGLATGAETTGREISEAPERSMEMWRGLVRGFPERRRVVMRVVRGDFILRVWVETVSLLYSEMRKCKYFEA